MTTTEDEHHSFTHRMVRWCAWLAVVFGSLNVVTAVVFLIAERFPFRGMRSYASDAVWRALALIVYCLLPLLQITGGAALLKWKSWGRRSLIVWSVLSAVLGLLSSLGFNYAYYRGLLAQNATTQPAVLSYLWVSLWNSFYSWTQSCVLPIILLVILLQPEVAKMWSRPASAGFDVIPMAQANDML